MTKNYVLHALRILDMDEMTKLSKVVKVSKASFKKAAGQELLSWADDEELPERIAPTQLRSAKVLDFKRPSTGQAKQDESTQEDQTNEKETPTFGLLPSELVLWQHELSKENSQTQQEAAFKGYKKSNQVYIVKTEEKSGGSKVRFASTNGVLVNKKQD